MSGVTAKGPPYAIGGEDMGLLREHRDAARRAAADQYYRGFGATPWPAQTVVHNPIIPEVEERNRRTLRELVEELEAEDRRKEQVGGTHYSDLTIQPWDAMRAWFTPEEYASYHIGTVIGYLSRHRRKGGLNDLKKAHHHLSELIRYFEEEEEYD